MAKSSLCETHQKQAFAESASPPQVGQPPTGPSDSESSGLPLSGGAGLLPSPQEPPPDRLRYLQGAAQAIAEAIKDACLDERELVTLFFQQGFFSALGYGAVGEDIRLEQRITRGWADVILRSFTGRPIALLEFKRPRTNLADHLSQLQEYALGLLPTVAVLTNGNDFCSSQSKRAVCGGPRNGSRWRNSVLTRHAPCTSACTGVMWTGGAWTTCV